jgi:hypothetical protein
MPDDVKPFDHVCPTKTTLKPRRQPEAPTVIGQDWSGSMPSDPLSLPLSPESPASPSASIFGDEDEKKYNDVYIIYIYNL